MRFALLGIDDTTARLIRSVHEHPEHLLAVAMVPADQAGLIEPISPHALSSESWEALLASKEIDVVVLGRAPDQDEHDERMRKLVQAGISLLVTHPSCSAIVAFEIDMIRRDVGGVVLPVFPGRSHPSIVRLRRWHDLPEESPIGPIEKLDFERVIEQPDEVRVRALLAHDAHFIGAIAGGISNVSAVGAGVDGRSMDNLTVHFGSLRQLPARWSSLPRGPLPARIILLGQTGSATLDMMAEPDQWVLEVNTTGHRERFEGWRPEAAILDDLKRALSGLSCGATWSDACHDLEVAETAQISLRRRRTLDVYAETPSQESSFKGVMAAGSCAILLLILCSFLLLAVVEGFRAPLADVADQPAERWPLLLRMWPVYPLLLFLGLQFLLFVARRPGRQVATTAESSSPEE